MEGRAGQESNVLLQCTTPFEIKGRKGRKFNVAAAHEACDASSGCIESVAPVWSVSVALRVQAQCPHLGSVLSAQKCGSMGDI